MTEKDRRRVLLVGLEDALLWQLTRSLAQAEPRIEYRCAADLHMARERCGQTCFDYIVVDGGTEPAETGYPMASEDPLTLGPCTWVFLVDTLPLEGFLDERLMEKAVFLEKPFNPKDFPAFLRDLEAGGAVEMRSGEIEVAQGPEHPTLPLEPGETYLSLAPDEGDTASEAMGEPSPAEEGSQDDFHACLEKGFACLKVGDREGARASWRMALELRPDDRRVRANLARLETVRKP